MRNARCHSGASCALALVSTAASIATVAACSSSAAPSAAPSSIEAGAPAATAAAPDAATASAPASDDASSPGEPGSLAFGGDAAAPPPCAGVGCRIHACGDGGSTTISGTVYDPAAQNPLYGVAVYVPSTPVAALVPGASCYSCSDLYSGHPVASAVTDADGHFTIAGAPDGASVPVVVQIGKWRMQYTLASVTACADNPQPDKSLRLPRNHVEGDLPSIAVSTGGADTLECLLRRIGVDASEYTSGPGSAGRVHVYRGADASDGSGAAATVSPTTPASSAALWDSDADLLSNDVVLLSCEGQETAGMNQQSLFDYAAAGGRVFASHFHYAWLDSGPFGAADLATWSPGTNAIGDVSADIVTTLPGSGQPFPRGVALQEWLSNVGALTKGELPIQAARHNADVTPANALSTPWIVADSRAPAPGATQYFSFDTPIGADAGAQCGRVVFSDLHVGAASGDYGGAVDDRVVPSGCADGELSPQEKALEFMLFDLSSCITPVDAPPAPVSVMVQ